eukprot:NODE_136_length_2977_cov_13.317544_g129_i0.p1 GENE.NODE_136_length_2977_cov_13.317544_g129_i0~~NODE_136_length_2977_cov_13.317544_g129_i0.p1  ORF type:complete len:932 (-),score=318.60 NODE_136_length_2977_cov_13.317544_g129_i0:180-2930(-)
MSTNEVRPMLLTTFIAQRPRTMLFGCLFLAIALASSNIWAPSLQGTTGVFMAMENPIVKTFFAGLEVNNDELTRDADQDPLSQQDWDRTIQVMFKTAKGGSILTRTYLDKIQAIALQLRAKTAKLCFRNAAGECDTDSLLPLFYGDAGYGDWLGTDPTTLCNDFEAIQDLVDRTFPTTCQTGVTRIYLRFGTPLPGYANSAIDHDKQRTDFNEYLSTGLVLVLDQARVDLEGVLEVAFHSRALEELYLPDIILNDMILFIGSIVMVGLFVLFQTRSFMITGLGLLHTVLSFGAAYFCYRVLLGYLVMPSMNNLALFIILGIGADDIFVFLDTWKRSHSFGPEVNKDLPHKLAFVWRSAGMAMLVTSFTTMIAFAATAFSPIPSISALGIFTSFTVLLNYLLVITYFPAVVVLYHLKWEFRTFGSLRQLPIPPTLLYFAEPSSKTTLELAVGGSSHPGSVEAPPSPDGTYFYTDDLDISGYRNVERFYYSKLFPLYQRWGHFILLAFLLLFAGCVVCAYHIEQPDKAESPIPEDHPVGLAAAFMVRHFPTSRVDIRSYVTLTWGLDEENPLESTSDMNDDLDNGQPLYSRSFDPAPLHQQRQLYALCRTLRDNTQMVRGMTDLGCVFEEARRYAVLQPTPVANGCAVAANRTDTALVQQRMDECVFPPDQYYTILKRLQQQFPHMLRVVGFSEAKGRVHWMKVTVVGMMETGLTNAQIVKDYEARWVPFVEQWNADPTHTTIRCTMGSMLYAWSVTTGVMGEAALMGVFVSAVLAFGVLLVATGNYIISLFAIVTIAGIILSVFSFMVVVGWKLGIMENICITILVGLSVDYVVHLAHAYIECEQTNRHDRTRYSMLVMGISVLSGAISTMSSSLVLFRSHGLLQEVRHLRLCVYSVFNFVGERAVLCALLPLRTSG